MKYSPVNRAMRFTLLFILVLLLLILVSNLFDSFQTALIENIRFQTIVTVLFLSPLIAALWYWSETVKQRRRQWSALFWPIRFVSVGLGIFLLIQVIVTFRSTS